MERVKGFEPSTSTLARLRSTPELRPHLLIFLFYAIFFSILQVLFFIFIIFFLTYLFFCFFSFSHTQYFHRSFYRCSHQRYCYPLTAT